MSHEASNMHQFEQASIEKYKEQVRAAFPSATEEDIAGAARVIAITRNGNPGAGEASPKEIEDAYTRRMQTHSELGNGPMVTDANGVVIGRMNKGDIPGAMEDERRAA